MRISEHRYARDRRALDVASRLIDFEARTSTIRELTGLSDERIRSLSKECGVDGRSCFRQRHRGASPKRVRTLLDKSRSRNEAATLLSVCLLMRVITQQQSPAAEQARDRLLRAERLCDAFWTFRYLLPETSIGFEHMLLLLSEASKGEEVAVSQCANCTSLVIADPLSLHRTLCSYCAGTALSGRKPPDTRQYLRVAEAPATYT